MKLKHLQILSLLFFFNTLHAQQGNIISRHNLLYEDYPVSFAWTHLNQDKKRMPNPEFAYLDSINVYEITYISDSLKVKGLLVTPKAAGHYPCIIYNRGGNRETGNLKISDAFVRLGRLAQNGYIVVAGYYRGNGGSEGKEEFGGADVNDVMNLIPLLNHVQYADTSRIGMYGWSRGGMMTYLALTRTNKMKAAVVGGALADLNAMMKERKEMESVYADLIPMYDQNKKKELEKRSANKWPCKISQTTPLLMLHGSADDRVPADQSTELSKQLTKCGIPHSLKIIEGGDHGLSKHRDIADKMVMEWFDRHLKNNPQIVGAGLKE